MALLALAKAPVSAIFFSYPFRAPASLSPGLRTASRAKPSYCLERLNVPAQASDSPASADRARPTAVGLRTTEVRGGARRLSVNF